jgi:hypothetical protein
LLTEYAQRVRRDLRDDSGVERELARHKDLTTARSLFSAADRPVSRSALFVGSRNNIGAERWSPVPTPTPDLRSSETRVREPWQPPGAIGVWWFQSRSKKKAKAVFPSLETVGPMGCFQT